MFEQAFKNIDHNAALTGDDLFDGRDDNDRIGGVTGVCVTAVNQVNKVPERSNHG